MGWEAGGWRSRPHYTPAVGGRAKGERLQKVKQLGDVAQVIGDVVRVKESLTLVVVAMKYLG